MLSNPHLMLPFQVESSQSKPFLCSKDCWLVPSPRGLRLAESDPYTLKFWFPVTAILMEYTFQSAQKFKILRTTNKVNGTMIMPKKCIGPFRSVSCVSPRGIMMSLVFLSSHFLEFVHIPEIPNLWLATQNASWVALIILTLKGLWEKYKSNLKLLSGAVMGFI